MAAGLIVHLEIAPNRRDEFVALARAHGKRSVLLEGGGCLSFEVFVPAENPQQVILVEKYVDSDALQAHWDSPHMADYVALTSGMIVSRTRYLCAV